MKKRLLALLLVFVLLLTACDDPAPEIDTATSFDQIQASKYIEIADDDYKGFDINLKIYDDTEEQVKSQILNLLNKYKPQNSRTINNDGHLEQPTIITAGDNVSFYYRGYLLNEDGTKNYLPNATNLPNEHKGLTQSPSSSSNILKNSNAAVNILDQVYYINDFIIGGSTNLVQYVYANSASLVYHTSVLSAYLSYPRQSSTVIDDVLFSYFDTTKSFDLPVYSIVNTTDASITVGEGRYVPNFESALVGRDILNYPSIGLKQSGSVHSDMTLFIQYTETIYDEMGVPFAYYHKEYVDLSQGEDVINAKYGFDMYNLLLGKEIGDTVKVVPEIEDINYSNVHIALGFENFKFNGDPIKATMPKNHSDPSVAGKEIYFEVFVESIKEYYDDGLGEGQYDDDFVTNVFLKKQPSYKKLLENYSDLSPKEQLIAFIRDTCKENRESNYRSASFNAIMEHYYSVANVIDYPTTIVNNLRDKYIEEFEHTYKVFTNSRGKYDENYKAENYSLDEFAQDCLNFRGDGDWKDDLEQIAKSDVKQILILRYVLEREGIDISEATLDGKIDEMILNNFYSYSNIYNKSTGKSAADHDSTDAYQSAVISYLKENYENNLSVAILQKMVFEIAESNLEIRINTLD